MTCDPITIMLGVLHGPLLNVYSVCMHTNWQAEVWPTISTLQVPGVNHKVHLL